LAGRPLFVERAARESSASPYISVAMRKAQDILVEIEVLVLQHHHVLAVGAQEIP